MIPTGFYQYKVMPFRLKNAPATFQRMIHDVLAGLEGCKVYIDDIVVFSDTWEQHMEGIRQFLVRLRQAQLTVNLTKSEFGQACITYLGHVVGKGGIKPIEAKVEAIMNFPTPASKSQLMRFLGMVGFYRKFCKNFAMVVEPLTRLLQKRYKFTWEYNQQKAFERVTMLLTTTYCLLTIVLLFTLGGQRSICKRS